MITTEEKEVKEALKNGATTIVHEPIPEEFDSPLSEPVIQKQVATEKQNATTTTTAAAENSTSNSGTVETSGNEANNTAEPVETDAPEQEITAQEGDVNPDEPGSESQFSIPVEEATLLANTILGATNNALEFAGGFFVTIKKRKEFYDFDELIQIIDKQNVKNIKRLKLDEEDKALLRPLLVRVLRQKAKILTPEQQLLTAMFSILIKKGRIVMEIKKENRQLEDRMVEIIRRELERHNGTKADSPSYEDVADNDEQQQEESEHEEEEDESSDDKAA